MRYILGVETMAHTTDIWDPKQLCGPLWGPKYTLFAYPKP